MVKYFPKSVVEAFKDDENNKLMIEKFEIEEKYKVVNFDHLD